MNWLDGWKKGSTSGTYICTLTKLETAIEGRSCNNNGIIDRKIS